MERISDGNANYNILCEETQKDAVSERANLFSVTERSLSVNVIKSSKLLSWFLYNSFATDNDEVNTTVSFPHSITKMCQINTFQL